MLIVIAYDITDDKRRRQLAQLLEGYGERVQKSVFECHLDRRRLARLRREMQRHADPQTDRIRIYTLCRRDARHVHHDGRGQPPRDIVQWTL